MSEARFDLSLVQPGMNMVGSDGRQIGTVVGVTGDRVTVERGTRPVVAVPVQFLVYVSGANVVSTIDSSRIDQMGWEVLGSSSPS